ncbi:MAG: polyprenyl synthetase family protein [Candidatus Omnitrophica bacterium]|nr:polyprenyl synthetase family protein [Candidatus Omnitrophota bacterium]
MGYSADQLPVERHLTQLRVRVERDLGALIPAQPDTAWITRYFGRPRWRRREQAIARTFCLPARQMLAGGKRWRPVLALLFLELLGAPHGPAARILTGIAELCHAGALMIDDVEDDSACRRHQPSVFRRYGKAVAINAGGLLYFFPFLAMVRPPVLTKAQQAEIFGVMVRVFSQAHAGQAADIYWPQALAGARPEQIRREGLEGAVLQMYADKTGAPLAGIAETAAIIARAKPALRRACRAFACRLGVAFQIVDDLMNYQCGGKGRVGAAEDFKAGKMTLVIARAPALLPAPARRQFDAVFFNPPARRSAAQRQRAVRLLRQYGVFDACRRRAQREYTQAFARLCRVFPDSRARRSLAGLCAQVLHGCGETMRLPAGGSAG